METPPDERLRRRRSVAAGAAAFHPIRRRACQAVHCGSYGTRHGVMPALANTTGMRPTEYPYAQLRASGTSGIVRGTDSNWVIPGKRVDLGTARMFRLAGVGLSNFRERRHADPALLSPNAQSVTRAASLRCGYGGQAIVEYTFFAKGFPL